MAQPNERAPKAPVPPRDVDEALDEASKESFPASDPPSWAPLHLGEPGEHPDPPRRPPPEPRERAG